MTHFFLCSSLLQLCIVTLEDNLVGLCTYLWLQAKEKTFIMINANILFYVYNVINNMQASKKKKTIFDQIWQEKILL